jgi:hypothetical protein
MNAPEPLTPTQFQLMTVVWDLADQVPAVSAWDVNHAAGERHGYRGHPTILRLLRLLVEKGYLTHDSDAGRRAGLYQVAVARNSGCAAFLDKTPAGGPSSLTVPSTLDYPAPVAI